MTHPLLIALGLSVSVLASACDGNEEPAGSRLRVAEALRDQGADLSGFDRADRPREFVFPADHGPHDGFRSEWWYWTGNLRAADGRRFGFHFTVFRTALAPDTESDGPEPSAFRTNQLYMGHFAVADIDGGRVFDDERFARGAGGLAGCSSEPFRLWIEDWRVEDLDETQRPVESIHLHGTQDSDVGTVRLDLDLRSVRDIVLQGEAGLSRKSSVEDAASYYYSIPRLLADGEIQLGDETLAVDGSAWFDREWSTSALDRDQIGWDWFALQLDDQRELMFYRLRRTDGSADPISQGVLVSNGAVRRLSLADVELQPSRSWTSPRSGATYPVAWRLRIPSADLDLQIEAALDDQELDLSFRYWEGAVRVAGSTTGVGYLEMTGYADR